MFYGGGYIFFVKYDHPCSEARKLPNTYGVLRSYFHFTRDINNVLL